MLSMHTGLRVGSFNHENFLNQIEISLLITFSSYTVEAWATKYVRCICVGVPGLWKFRDIFLSCNANPRDYGIDG